MKSVGFFYTVFTEKKAVEYSIEQLRKWYPSSPIYLVSDGGLDFSYLKNDYDDLETKLEEDTISETFGITAGSTGCDYISGNYRQEQYQNAIKKCVAQQQHVQKFDVTCMIFPPEDSVKSETRLLDMT